MNEINLKNEEENPSEEKIILWALSYFLSKLLHRSNLISQKHFRFPDGSIPTRNDLDKIFYLKNKLGEMILERKP